MLSNLTEVTQVGLEPRSSTSKCRALYTHPPGVRPQKKLTRNSLAYISNG